MRFERKGPLALAASAYGQDYELVTPAAPTQDGGVAVVMIMGPLTHHGEWWVGDTYDQIEGRVSAALATSADTVVLKISSPGGEVNGCFECARTLRKLATAAGKKLVAYVDEFAASAAYAIACAASAIYLPPSGMLGSIGVIECVADETGADAIHGYKVSVVTSGARKADGNPHAVFTDEARLVMQTRVNSIAGLFYELVAEARGIQPLAVAALEAAIFQGPFAVQAKLADAVVSWDELLAMLASGETSVQPAPTATGAQEGTDMKRSALIAALKAALAEADPAPAPDKTDEPDGDEPMKKEELIAALKAALAEADPAPAPDKDSTPPPAPDKEPDGDEAKAKALAAAAGIQARPTPPGEPMGAPGHHYLPNASAATGVIAELEQRVRKMEDEKRIAAETSERAGLLASVQMTDGTRKWLSDPATPMADVRAACKALPAAMLQNPAAAAMVVPTPARGQASASAPSIDAKTARDLSAMMGLPVPEPSDIRWGGASGDPNDTTTEFDRVFPASMSRDDARAMLKANQERMRASAEALRKLGGAR